MNGKSWQRARSSEQVQERVSEILEGAAAVFLSVPYEKATMQMIAREAGFTRSNLYRYFNTREEIFLALFMKDLDAWAHSIIAAFNSEDSLKSFARRWTELLCRQTRLLRLTPLLTITLEKNTSEEVYRQTKLTLHEKMTAVVPHLQRALPSLSDMQVFEFLLFHQALLSGAQPMARYSDMQLRVLDELKLQVLKIDFAAFYEKSILMYLRGVLASGEDGPQS